MESMRTESGSKRRLDSWKEIAAHLRRHERTVIRWEKKGLPVHRVPGGERQAVFAYTDELDAWLKRDEQPTRATTEASTFSQPIPEVGGPRAKQALYRWVASGTTLVLLLFAAALLTHRFRPSFPVRIDFTLNAIQAFDDRNQLLWAHTLPGTLNAPAISSIRPLADFSRIGDFRGRGDREVLVVAPIRIGPNAEDPTQTLVDLFSSRGELLWSYIPSGKFQFGKHELNGPWKAGDIFVSSIAGRAQIWVAIVHLVWGNSFVVNLDPVTGKDTLRFVNTGVVRALSELTTPKGKLLLVGGFNNEEDTGSLAVIDENKSFAASPQTEGTRHKCLSCPPGDPDYYFVFPRSEINELQQFHDDAVIGVNVTGNQIELRKQEVTPDSGTQTVYLLSAENGIRLVSLRFESTYDMLHRKLEQEGKIGHSLEHCPERLHPRPVRMWTPSGGWTEIPLPPMRADE